MKTKSYLKRYKLQKLQTELPNIKLGSSKNAADFIRQFYFDDIAIWESFFLLMLNNQNQTIGFAKISQGGITATVVDIRLIAKYAIDSLATAVLLCHNHPSGQLKASDADKQMTEKISKALDLLDIKVLDHIILTENDFYSFADNGLI